MLGGRGISSSVLNGSANDSIKLVQPQNQFTPKFNDKTENSTISGSDQVKKKFQISKDSPEYNLQNNDTLGQQINSFSNQQVKVGMSCI